MAAPGLSDRQLLLKTCRACGSSSEPQDLFRFRVHLV